ncbi:hypothetical protein HDU97_000519 [Phlyctochytrium planicorne]|nr:hypothetical protein HDU97_000519 [Phlyctochytrium planicorne]
MRSTASLIAMAIIMGACVANASPLNFDNGGSSHRLVRRQKVVSSNLGVPIINTGPVVPVVPSQKPTAVVPQPVTSNKTPQPTVVVPSSKDIPDVPSQPVSFGVDMTVDDGELDLDLQWTHWSMSHETDVVPPQTQDNNNGNGQQPTTSDAGNGGGQNGQPRTNIVTSGSPSSAATDSANNDSANSTQGSTDGGKSATEKRNIIIIAIVAASALGLFVASWIFRKVLCSSSDMKRRRLAAPTFGRTLGRKNKSQDAIIKVTSEDEDLKRELDHDDLFGGRLDKRKQQQQQQNVMGNVRPASPYQQHHQPAVHHDPTFAQNQAYHPYPAQPQGYTGSRSPTPQQFDAHSSVAYPAYPHQQQYQGGY